MPGFDTRRRAPRIPLEGLCGVVNGRDIRHASLSNLSALGIRLGRPFDPARAQRQVQLEIELPEVDEIVWAQGEVTFAHLSPMGGRHANGEPRFWCEAGIRLRGVSSSERRLLRDYVIDTRRMRERLEVNDGIPIYWH